MFLTLITAQESYLIGFLTTLPLLVVVTETAGSVVETPEAGTETTPRGLVVRTLVVSAWTTEELFGTTEVGLLFDVSRAGSLVGAPETAASPLATPSGCCCCDRLTEKPTNGAVRNGSLVCLRCLRFLLYIRPYLCTNLIRPNINLLINGSFGSLLRVRSQFHTHYISKFQSV